MKKTIIVIWGAANRGKSATIRGVLKQLRNITGNSEPLLKGDVHEILEVKGQKIGVESQGDPNSRLFSSLREFHSEQCDIILCATRTKGKTVRAVEDYKHNKGYDVIWLSNLQSWKKEQSEAQIVQKKLNELTAKFVFENIRLLLDGKL